MSTQKMISKLTVAIAAVLVAAVPAFAQTDSVNLQSDSQTMVTTADSSNAIAWNGAFKLENPFKTVTAAPTIVSEKQISVSPTIFKMALNRLGSDSFVNTPTTNFQVWNPAEQVKAPETKVTSPKRITFVPSLGQKLPD
jgi:hypothetical protein